LGKLDGFWSTFVNFTKRVEISLEGEREVGGGKEHRRALNFREGIFLVWQSKAGRRKGINRPTHGQGIGSLLQGEGSEK